MKPSRSEFHDIRGLRYHVRTWGEPHHPRLILLHGWMDVSASFQFLVDCFARDWHVVAPDWRGFGLTQWSQDGYWFPDYYADLDRLLDLYPTEGGARLVGHSMGGNIAVTYAGLRPGRIARLATLEGLGMARTRAEAAPRRLVKWLDSHYEPPRFRSYATFGEVAARLKKNNPRLDDAQAEFLAPHWARETQFGAVELRSDPRHKSPNPYLFRIDEALEIWRNISAPVLLVNGRNSHIPGWLKDDAAELAQRKAAYRTLGEVDLDDCGHMMHYDQPARLARILEDFFPQDAKAPAAA